MAKLAKIQVEKAPVKKTVKVEAFSGENISKMYLAEVHGKASYEALVAFLLAGRDATELITWQRCASEAKKVLSGKGTTEFKASSLTGLYARVESNQRYLNRVFFVPKGTKLPESISSPKGFDMKVNADEVTLNGKASGIVMVRIGSIKEDKVLIGLP